MSVNRYYVIIWRECKSLNNKNTLHFAGISDRTVRRKPFINAKNWEKWIDFAIVYLQKSLTFWENVMIWKCIFYNLSINADKYIDLLRDNSFNDVIKLGMEERYHFQWDNDPKYIAIKIKKNGSYIWCTYVTYWQPQLLNINLIKNLWLILDLEIKKEKY